MATPPPPTIPPLDQPLERIDGYELVIVARDRTPLCGWPDDGGDLVVWADAEALAVALRGFIEDMSTKLEAFGG